MIIISALKDLLPIIQDLLYLFAPGFIFMMVYIYFNNKKIDIGIFTILCLFISYFIKVGCSFFHLFLFSNININETIKIVIYFVLAFIFAMLFTMIKNTKLTKALFNKVNNKSIYDNIFDGIIDYQKPTTLQIYLKSSKTQYTGRFVCIEEKGLDSWIVLADYVRYVNDVEVFCPVDYNIKSSVTINLHDIESIEIIYKDDSNVWKEITKETKKRK